MNEFRFKDYLLISHKDIENVYKPSLEFLNDNFLPSNFPKNEEQIKSCMEFYRVVGYGEDYYEKEYFDYKEYDNKNKGHHFKGINYKTLNSKLDFTSFEKELINRIEYLQEGFLDELDDFKKKPNFEIPLYNHIKLIVESIISLKKIEVIDNPIVKFVKDKFIESYFLSIENLGLKYKDIYEKPFKFLDKTDIYDNKNEETNEQKSTGTNKNIWINIFYNENDFLLFKQYLENEITNDYSDISYVYGKLIKENRIIKSKHLDFNNWMFNNKLIKDNIYNKINDAGGFRTLDKSFSVEKEKKFNRVFKK